jgi:hypothetical protein
MSSTERMSVSMDGIDFDKLVLAPDYYGEDPEDQALLVEMINRGQRWLLSHKWCESISECYVGDVAIGGIVVVLLTRIVPSKEDVDEWLWVVVGDVPPAYLVTDDAPNPASALHVYLQLVNDWVAAAQRGEDVSELMPLESTTGELLSPTAENAAALRTRLDLIQRLILDYHQDDLAN